MGWVDSTDNCQQRGVVYNMERKNTLASLLEFQEESTQQYQVQERVSKIRTKMHTLVLVIKRLLVVLIRAVSVKSETRWW